MEVSYMKRRTPMEILFRTEEHEAHYGEILSKMKSQDCYHRAIAYLFALDDCCYEHLDLLFDFKDDGIIVDGVNGGWHTGSSKRTVRLAFNLWNDYMALSQILCKPQTCIKRNLSAPGAFKCIRSLFIVTQIN